MGGTAEGAQNSTKNNFCAVAPAKPVTIANLQTLQSQVASNPAINFGDESEASRKAGPTTNRAPLVQLGERGLVVFQGFILIARQEGGEGVNCATQVPNQPVYHDIHISLVESSTATLADECSSVVAEMIPHHRPDSWTQANVESVAAAHSPVRLTGQLFFDSSHYPCSNGQPVRSNPKRSSLWEIHPIYRFEVCQTSHCAADDSNWLPLDQWVGMRAGKRGRP